MDILRWIQKWYLSNCDGYWEHMYGVEIGSLDNPGWSVDIDLTETPLENASFDCVQYDRGDGDWVICVKKDDRYKARGGSEKLEEMLLIFKRWAEMHSPIQ
jgi:hypothetical protein